MSTRTLSAPYLSTSQARKEITHNEALNVFDVYIGGVFSRSTGGPPASPEQGDAYIVDVATGDWSGFAVSSIVVYYLNSAGTPAWLNYPAVRGPALFVQDEDAYILYNGLNNWDTVGSVVSVINEATAARTLSLEDANRYVRCTATCTVTVPLESAVNFQKGSQVTIRRAGADPVTITPGAGVTINGSVTLSAQHDYVTLIKVGADEWDAA